MFFLLDVLKKLEQKGIQIQSFVSKFDGKTKYRGTRSATVTFKRVAELGIEGAVRLQIVQREEDGGWSSLRVSE